MKDLHFKCRPGQKDTPYRQGYHIVLIIKGTILENFIVLHLNVLNLDLRPYFILFSALMSEMDLKQQMIYNYIPPFPAKCLGPPRN